MALTAPFGDDVPRTIDGYQLLAPVGEGGMGRVFVAERSVVGGVARRYAIKLLHANLRAEREVADQLLAEAELAAFVAHPNVVQVIGGGEAKGHVYVVMEYVDGVTLADIVRHAIRRERPVPLPIVARILSDALSGLHAAHEARGADGAHLGIVHRDFSPQNILVGSDGIAKLTDFGIAKAITRIAGTATGIVKGKVAYLSPEQAMGQPLDRRSDVWAAGVVLWESLARRRLFAEPTDTATLLAIVSGPSIPPPSSVWGEVPIAVDDVVLGALERDPTARYDDAEELRQRLVQAVGLEGRVAHHVEVARYIAELVRTRRQEVGAQVERIQQAPPDLTEEVSGPASAVRPVARLPLETLPLDEALDDRPDEKIPLAPKLPEVTSEAPPRKTAAYALVAILTLGVGGIAAWQVTATPSQRARDGLAPEVPTVAAPAPPAAQPLELQVVANAPIAQLTLGERNRLLPEPKSEFAVPLEEPIGDGGLTVVGVTSDGRRAEASLGPGEATVTLAFHEPAAAPSTTPARPTPSRPTPSRPSQPRPRKKVDKPPPAAKDGPGLGPSPYSSTP